jgi:uncharacterized protein
MQTNLITVTDLIQALDLRPLSVEGGWFTQSYLSPERIPAQALPARYAPDAREDKPFATAIYYLLTSDPDSFSALHRLPTDEIFHFYLGCPVEGLLLYSDGSHSLVTLGQDVLSGQRLQFVVPRGVWQGWRLRPRSDDGGAYALLGTTMAPGFTPADFELASRAALSARYPAQAKSIAQLTRE